MYYVGALAGGNDLELLNRTRVGRDINRHYYTADEIAADLERPVVRALFGLCRFRNEVPAFDGELEVSLDGSVLTMRRRGSADAEAWAELRVDLASGGASIDSSGGSYGDLMELAGR